MSEQQPGTATAAVAGTGRDTGPGRGAGSTWAAEPVPHAIPLDVAAPEAGPHAQPRTEQPRTEQPRTEGPRTEGPRTEQPRTEGPATPPAVAEPLSDEQLNRQIIDALGELIKRAHELGQSIATEQGLASSDAIALLKLEGPMTMKELGQRMSCDPSFITAVADALEKHGLARREPSQRDRRSKNIVLTPEGVTVRDRLSAELAARAPWCTALGTGERRCLLALIRKMLDRTAGGDVSQPRSLSRPRR